MGFWARFWGLEAWFFEGLRAVRGGLDGDLEEVRRFGNLVPLNSSNP